VSQQADDNPLAPSPHSVVLQHVPEHASFVSGHALLDHQGAEWALRHRLLPLSKPGTPNKYGIAGMEVALVSLPYDPIAEGGQAVLRERFPVYFYMN
jgi:hypothetical protein